MKTKILFALFLFSSLLFSGCLFDNSSSSSVNYWSYSNGLIQVSSNRPYNGYKLISIESNTSSLLLENITYSSIDSVNVSALLAIPQQNGIPLQNTNGAVFMPGASVNKEGGWNNATGQALEKSGFTVIIIDARGVGDTPGPIEPLQNEVADFSSGNLSQSHLQIFDYLGAFDVLSHLSTVNSSRIIMSGESNGARFAIIACALAPRAVGVLAISTAGFGMSFNSNPQLSSFFYSIDPDNYVGLISPRPVIFMHSKVDPEIPYQDALTTYSYANSPKQFITINCSNHGFCENISGLVGLVSNQMIANYSH